MLPIFSLHATEMTELNFFLYFVTELSQKQNL